MKRHPSLLLPGCLQVSDDSLSSHVYHSAPVQLSLPPTFCPLAFAVISDDHSRFDSWKKHTDCKHTETQACLLSSGILQQDTGFLFFIFLVGLYVFCLPASRNHKTNQTLLFSAYMHIVFIGLTTNWTAFDFLIQGFLRKCISHSSFFLVSPLSFFFFCLLFSTAKPLWLHFSVLGSIPTEQESQEVKRESSTRRKSSRLYCAQSPDNNFIYFTDPGYFPLWFSVINPTSICASRKYRPQLLFRLLLLWWKAKVGCQWN